MFILVSKKTSSPADIPICCRFFQKLQNEDDGIEDFGNGVNSSPEGIIKA